MQEGGAFARAEFFRCDAKTPARFQLQVQGSSELRSVAARVRAGMPDATDQAMTASNSRVAASGAPDIRVSTADDGGWVVTIDRAGRTVATERYSDWHRVERRVAILNLTIGAEAAARVAAMWCAAAVPLAVLGT